MWKRATTSHFKQSLGRFGIIVRIIAALVHILYVYMLCKKCKEGKQKILRKEMSVWHSATSIAMVHQQMQPRQNYV